MVNINPNRESCMEYMKELIRKGLNQTEVIKECKKSFSDVHESTYYDWYEIVIEQQDIQSWQEDNRIEIIDKRADKINFKHQIYLDQKKIYSDITSDKEEKEKAMNILLTHFLKRVE